MKAGTKLPKVVTNSLIMKLARQTMIKLGVGHTESVYQTTLVSLFMACGIPAMTEVNIPYFVDGICVGVGRADILLPSYLIELKANQKNPCRVSAQTQLAKYLRSMHLQGASPRNGLLIMFNTPSQGPLKNRVSFIEIAHEDAMDFVPNRNEKKNQKKKKFCVEKESLDETKKNASSTS